MKKILPFLMMFFAVTGILEAQVIADFEFIPFNMMLGGAEDESNMVVVQNPDQSGINTSWYVVQFTRDKDGVPWGGFWSGLPEVIDVTR